MTLVNSIIVVFLFVMSFTLYGIHYGLSEMTKCVLERILKTHITVLIKVELN